jgi:hypothetical protein
MVPLERVAPSAAVYQPIRICWSHIFSLRGVLDAIDMLRDRRESWCSLCAPIGPSVTSERQPASCRLR